MRWMLKGCRPQFGLRTILWIMLLIASVITAYQRGYRTGFFQGENYRNSVGVPYIKPYPVADLVTFDPATTSNLRYADDLIGDLCKEVLPNTWVEQGGQATVAAYASNGTIVVSHDQDGHNRIAAYLEQRRIADKKAPK